MSALPNSVRFPSVDEIGSGVAWGVVVDNAPTQPVVPAQPGLNTVQVVVADGQGGQAQALARVLIGRASG